MREVFMYEGDITDALVSQGRNGRCWTIGIEIMLVHGGNYVSLTPITSKGKPQNCYIEVTPAAMTELSIFWLGQLPPEKLLDAVGTLCVKFSEDSKARTDALIKETLEDRK